MKICWSKEMRFEPLSLLQKSTDSLSASWGWVMNNQRTGTFTTIEMDGFAKPSVFTRRVKEPLFNDDSAGLQNE